jgi:hypothetical protein
VEIAEAGFGIIEAFVDVKDFLDQHGSGLICPNRISTAGATANLQRRAGSNR